MFRKAVVAASVALMLGASSSAFAEDPAANKDDIYPWLAAKRQIPYASRADRSGAYYFGPAARRAYAAQPRTRALTATATAYRVRLGRNLPYPDRPYGHPNGW